jgi:beta-lactamase class A
MRPPTVAPATSIARIGEDSTLPTRSPLALPATPTAPVVVSDPLAATPLSEPIVTPTVPIVADDPLTSTDELVPPAFPANELNVLLEHTGGTFGVVVYDLSSEVQVYARNETLSFSAASLIKVPIALTIHRLAEQGQLDLHTTLELRAEDIVGGTGVLQYREIGTTYSIEELVFLMLAESDNTATNMLLEHIGGFEVVNRLMDEVGATQTRMQRLMMDLDAIQQGRDNLTSPADMSLMLQLLSQDTVVNGASAQKIRAALQQTSDQQKIPANLPAGTIVMHKIGSLPNVEHDAGIVTTPQGRRYIVVFMSAQLPGNQAGIATIAQASRLIFDYESRLDP